MLIECKNCSNKFNNSVYFQRFCSKECRESYWKKENKGGREYKRNLYNARKIYEKSNDVVDALESLSEKDKDYLAESIAFLLYLYPDKTMDAVFKIVQENQTKR